MTQRRDRNGRRKSDPGTVTYRTNQERTMVAAELPWGAPKVVPLSQIDYSIPTGIFAGKSLLLDLFNLFERKLSTVIDEEPIEKLLNKSLQRGGDAYMDNLCRSLTGVCESSLPSFLKALIDWHARTERSITEKINPANENRFLLNKKLLAINYLFCLVLIEILPTLELHGNSCEVYIMELLDLAFKQVQYKDPTTLGVNHTNSLVVAETYAEVIGSLSESRFSYIHRRFVSFLTDFRKDNSPSSSHQIVSLLMAMKFVKIRTTVVEDFESGISFLDDLGSLFLEVKDKDVKHAVAGLLVEILLPVAAQIKRETNIPALIAFVGKLYSPTNELVSKKQHKLAAYPLLTCLLCVSQRQFFLTNWVPFLNNALANLKNRDSRISRVALESLYRLLWVYMIRNNMDSNTSTRTRLESICGSLFPKGNRGIVPRDAPLNIFVKIIHFIAQQKLDFAFKDVIFDLLCCNRTQRSLYPERMNIGIRAVMVIADGLLQKDDPPAMPKSMGPSASGTIQRMKKKTYVAKPLTVDVARSIGLEQYYLPCRKAFDSILRILDVQVGKPLMLTAIQKGKEPEELLGGDVKPKLDLFRTCVAAVRRLLPEPMSHTELIEILTRVTIHLDDELRNLAGNTLQTLMDEFPEWREHIISAFLQLIHQHLTDFYPNVLDETLRLLLQLVSTWRTAVSTGKKKDPEAPPAPGHLRSADTVTPPPLYYINYTNTLHSIEGLALVMLCQIRTQPRKIAISLLREVKQLFVILNIEMNGTPVITVLDEATPYVVKKYIEHVPMSERMSWNLDFGSVCDKISVLETDNCLVNSDRGNEYLQWDPWACALAGYTEKKYLLSRCPAAVNAAWPGLFSRLNAVNGYVDPNNPQNESRASLLRGSKSKASSICGEVLSVDGCLSLWQKYLLMCCAFAPASMTISSLASRSFSPTSSMESDVLRSVSSSIRGSRAPIALSLSQLITKVAAMLKWENMTDIRDSVVLGVGCLNPFVFDNFLDELNQRGILREALEKKIENNVRRKKRKDLLRLQLVRLFEVAVMRGLLQSALIDSTGSLNTLLIDFVDAMRINLESDQDRDMAIITSLRLHFAKLVALLIDSVAPEYRANLIPDDRKQSLFYLFIGWCSRTIAAEKKSREKDVGSYVEQKAVLAMTRLLCCGPIFEASKSIGEDGYLYGWLEKLVASPNPTMQVEVEEMLAWMLELNESSFLLDWLMQQCYSQPCSVAARCFCALVRVFSKRDFPCEFVSLFVLCQTMCGNPTVTDAAVHMIEILRRQFLENNASVCSPLAGNTSSPTSVVFRSVPEQQMLTSIDGHCYPIEQLIVCKQLAKHYPHLTITIFSEVSCRLDNARSQTRSYLLSLLLPWIENLELVDPVAGEDACEGPRGWGSEEATQLLLNNLMYLTATLLVEHEHELAELWRALAVSFPANLPVILNYLYVITVLSHEALLPHTKRIAVMLAGAVGNRLAALLLEQLTTSADYSKLTLERSEIPPYYRWKEENAGDRKQLSAERKQSLGDVDNLEEESRQEGVRLLPMPAYGGHYSPLSGFLPPTTQPVQFFTRSQVALMLICDTVRASSDVDWTEATPRLLHSGILGLDSLRPALCRHARQTIINVCLIYADQACLAQVSALLLKNQLCRVTVEPFLSDAWQLRRGSSRDVNRGESPSFTRATEEEYRQMLLHSNAIFSCKADLIKSIVFCLSEDLDQPLWPNEDATPRNWKVASAAQLTYLVRHLAELLLYRMPLLPVVWTQISMRMALATQQRHSAGRCFQIVSALCQPLCAWVPSLISRLVETAGEAHEDTQAYVTDLLYCILNSAPHLSPVVPEPPPIPCASPTHARSTSYTPALLRQSVMNQRFNPEKEQKDARFSMLVAEEEPWVGAALMRSKSADQLKTDGEGDEEATARMQICAVAVSLLDSGMENEFLLAVHLLEKILDTAGAHKLQCLQKLEKTIGQLEWKSFQGIVRLVVRGIVIPNAYEPTIQALIRLLDVLDEPVVGGRDSLGFVLCHILPYLLVNYEAPTPLCVAASTAIRQYCLKTIDNEVVKADHPFNHLATIMAHYNAKTFTKDRWQWTKCVLQYLVEGIDNSYISPQLVLLAEMLERGPQSTNTYVLHMIYLLLLHRDLSDSPLSINAQVIRVVGRHVQGSNWREASRVYKAILEQWHTTDGDKTTDESSLSLTLDLNMVGERRSPPSPRKTLDTTLKRQPPPHIRVRDRLVGLLSASGLRVGLPSAQSVVFSQSELGSTASSTERICASSQEVASTGSLPDPSASITDSFPRVFKEFDFLEAEHDTVSETAESCFGWLSTMRPRSIGESEKDYDLDADDDEDSESAQARSEAGDNNSRLSRASENSSEERTPCPSEGEEDDEDDEAEDGFDELSARMNGSELQDRLSPRTSSSREGFERGFTNEEVPEVESVDGSSFCCRSQTSVSYYGNIVQQQPFFVQCSHHCDGKIEQQWLSVMSEVGDDSDGELTALATLLLTQLFRTCCSSVVALLRDAAHLFTSRTLARAFTTSQDVLAKVVDCPFLFVTPLYVRGNNLLQRLKCSLYEMREHVETFNERKEQSVRVLNSVRSAYKLTALGGSTSSLSAHSETDLAKHLSKMFFQLMQMNDALHQMIQLIQESPGSHAYSLSPAVLEHQRELLLCVSDLPTAEILPTRSEVSGDSLVLLMANRNYAQALISVRMLRTTFGGEFGCCEQSDIDVLLLLFCRSHTLKAWALAGAAPDAMQRQSQALREANADMASAVRRAGNEGNSVQGTSQPQRTSTVSSLNDSFAKLSYHTDM
ncbi:unnamed protein product [Auanema sp. JU1783]|nr:unnamed protein product [Auanema sp. JU1783]